MRSNERHVMSPTHSIVAKPMLRGGSGLAILQSESRRTDAAEPFQRGDVHESTQMTGLR
jgi:hypothetical protein